MNNLWVIDRFGIIGQLDYPGPWPPPSHWSYALYEEWPLRRSFDPSLKPLESEIIVIPISRFIDVNGRNEFPAFDVSSIPIETLRKVRGFQEFRNPSSQRGKPDQ